MDSNKEASARRLLGIGTWMMLAGVGATALGVLLLVGLALAVWLGL